MTERNHLVTTARAEALFVSYLPTGATPSRDETEAAIQWAVRVCHGTRGCAAELAAAYGERPETACRRMQWARQVVLAVYCRSSR